MCPKFRGGKSEKIFEKAIKTGTRLIIFKNKKYMYFFWFWFILFYHFWQTLWRWNTSSKISEITVQLNFKGERSCEVLHFYVWASSVTVIKRKKKLQHEIYLFNLKNKLFLFYVVQILESLQLSRGTFCVF